MNVYRVLSPEVKRDHSLPSGAKVKNEWSNVSTPKMPLWYVRVQRYLFLLKEILQILTVG